MRVRLLSATALLVLLASATRAQAPEADSTAQPDSLVAALAVEPVEPPPAPEPRTAEPTASQPTMHAFGATGLRVLLPAGWDGPTASLDEDPSSYALYTFTNAAQGHPLFGAVLRIQRVQALNQLLRERWRQGQTPYGYHGTRPIGPAGAPLPGTALEIEGSGTGGAVVFLQRGLANWAVQIEAPAAVWAQNRGAALAVLAGVAIP